VRRQGKEKIGLSVTNLGISPGGKKRRRSLTITNRKEGERTQFERLILLGEKPYLSNTILKLKERGGEFPHCLS